MSRRGLVAVVGAVMIAVGGCGGSSTVGPDIVSALPDPQEQGWETWDIWFADYAALGVESIEDIQERSADGTVIPLMWRTQADNPEFANTVGWDESDIEQFAAVADMGSDGLLVLRGPTRDDVLQGEIFADLNGEEVGDHTIWEVVTSGVPSMPWGDDTHWVAFPADDLVLWSSDRDLLDAALALQDGDGTELTADPVTADTLAALSTDVAMLMISAFEPHEDRPAMFGSSSSTSTDGVTFARGYASEDDAQAALDDVDALVADPSGSIVADIDDATTGVDGHAVHITGTTTRPALWRDAVARMDPIMGIDVS